MLPHDQMEDFKMQLVAPKYLSIHWPRRIEESGRPKDASVRGVRSFAAPPAARTWSKQRTYSGRESFQLALSTLPREEAKKDIILN